MCRNAHLSALREIHQIEERSHKLVGVQRYLLFILAFECSVVCFGPVSPRREMIDTSGVSVDMVRRSCTPRRQVPSGNNGFLVVQCLMDREMSDVACRTGSAECLFQAHQPDGSEPIFFVLSELRWSEQDSVMDSVLTFLPPRSGNLGLWECSSYHVASSEKSLYGERYPCRASSNSSAAGDSRAHGSSSPLIGTSSILTSSP